MAGKGNRKTPYLFIAPFLVMFAAFKLYPMVYGFAVSFLDRNSTKKLTSTAFAGLKNYTNVLASESFWQSLGAHTFPTATTVTSMPFPTSRKSTASSTTRHSSTGPVFPIPKVPGPGMSMWRPLQRSLTSRQASTVLT